MYTKQSLGSQNKTDVTNTRGHKRKRVEISLPWRNDVKLGNLPLKLKVSQIKRLLRPLTIILNRIELRGFVVGFVYFLVFLAQLSQTQPLRYGLAVASAEFVSVFRVSK